VGVTSAPHIIRRPFSPLLSLSNCVSMGISDVDLSHNGLRSVDVVEMIINAGAWSL